MQQGTDMNERSSRSHTVFQLRITGTRTLSNGSKHGDSALAHTYSHLHMCVTYAVDLVLKQVQPCVGVWAVCSSELSMTQVGNVGRAVWISEPGGPCRL